VGKGGARPGDALILTKALGTGTVMAAEMAIARLPGLILGEAVAAALAQMGQPQAGAAAVLAPLAHAMTDVTGFGLAAHLLEMLEASGMAARLEAAAVPLLPGALELAAAGVASALAPGNRAVTVGRLVMAEGPLKALLHDPQTAGGLLAVVPPGEAAALVAALRAQGLPAAQIGTVEAGPVRLTVG
jgi:selenide,water dikinase